MKHSQVQLVLATNREWCNDRDLICPLPVLVDSVMLPGAVVPTVTPVTGQVPAPMSPCGLAAEE